MGLNIYVPFALTYQVRVKSVSGIYTMHLNVEKVSHATSAIT